MTGWYKEAYIATYRLNLMTMYSNGSLLNDVEYVMLLDMMLENCLACKELGPTYEW